jgi:hypothetical protein
MQVSIYNYLTYKMLHQFVLLLTQSTYISLVV